MTRPHIAPIVRGLNALAKHPELLASEKTVIRLAIAELEYRHPGAPDLAVERVLAGNVVPMQGREAYVDTAPCEVEPK